MDKTPWDLFAPISLHPCVRYGAKKIENFFFDSIDVKMILNVFWTCFDDFCFSRSPNPLHDYMYKVWAKKIENFFLFLML